MGMISRIKKFGLSRSFGLLDTPADGAVHDGITANWAYDHAANFGLHTKVVRKTADETVNNSDTLQNDDELLFAIGANEVYVFDLSLLIVGNATADIKTTWAIPSGATINRFEIGYSTTGTFTGQWKVGIDPLSWGAFATDTLLSLNVRGIIVNGGTAGNAQLQWAQNVATAADTTIKANSCIIATRLA